MTLRNPAWAFQGVSHSAELAKQMQQSQIAGTGVVEPGDLLVSALGTPNMSVNVAAGSIWIPGTQGSTTGEGTNMTAQSSAIYGTNMLSSFTSQGCYFAFNDATVNLAISAANATNPRIDAVVASIQDSTYSGGTQTPVLQVIAGTPASIPAPPNTIPPNSVVLAQVYVGASVSSINAGNVTDTRPFMAPNPTVVQNFLGRDQIAMKPSDQSITTSTTLANDNDLVIPVTAGKTYILEADLFFQCTANGPDGKFAFTFPAGTMAYGYTSIDTSSTAFSPAAVQIKGLSSWTSGSPASFGIVGDPTFASPLLVKGSYVCTTSGSVRLQWCQAISSGSAVLLQAGSWLRLTSTT